MEVWSRYRQAPFGTVARYALSETEGESRVSRGKQSIAVATQGYGWCGARALGGWAGDTLSDCLSLSSLSARPSPAPKPVPLGDESGESPLLKMPFQG